MNPKIGDFYLLNDNTTIVMIVGLGDYAGSWLTNRFSVYGLSKSVPTNDISFKQKLTRQQAIDMAKQIFAERINYLFPQQQ